MRWEIRREQRDGQKEQAGTRQGEWVGRAHLEQLRCDEARRDH
jgi:hypothetical protein